jgi:2-succinyl-5-enolpyruvyl-6-hydroxy-3-cyclohexene-1-carboxylate synthase
VEVGNHEPSRETAVHFRSLACRAWLTALGGRPGVVHLNLPLRLPLAPVPEELDASDWEGRPDGRPWTIAGDVPPSEKEGEPMDVPGRGALVCGAGSAPETVAIAELASATRWPVLADAVSGLRCGPHDRSHVIAHYDVLLRDERFAAAHAPQMVVRFGDTPTSKPLRAWLGRAERQLVVDPQWAWHEPTRTADTILRATPQLAAAERAPAWLESWREADALVPQAVAEAPDPFEPKAYAALAEVLPDVEPVYVASSMPIREVEAFFPTTDRRIHFLANRGANGIDGTISSAAGAALAAGGRAHVLIGDLALLHDIGGLITAKRLGVELTIVCVNNGGGGIFDFLPVADSADRELYEEHIATPAPIELARVAALVDVPHTVASTPDQIRAAAARPGLVEVSTSRAESVALHRELYAKVADRLRG